MAIITLEDAKSHLGLTTDVDDLLLTGKIEAAEAMLENMLGFSIAERFTNGVPGDIKEAIRQLVAHYYENREAAVVGVSAGYVPFGVADVIRNRRVWQVTDGA